MPNYGQTITTDPAYMSLQQLVQAQAAADAAARAQAVQRALVQFGQVPDALTFPNIAGDLLASDITDTVRQLAAENTTAGLSTVSRLRKANQDAQTALANSLAARGMLQSGEYGYQLGQQGLAYRQAEYDARQQLLDYLGQVYGAWTSAEQQRAWQLAQGLQSAAEQQWSYPWNQVPAGYQAGTVAPTTGPPPASGGAAAGYPIPTRAQIEQMARWVPKARKHRPQRALDLFGQFREWRQANPGWWQ